MHLFFLPLTLTLLTPPLPAHSQPQLPRTSAFGAGARSYYAMHYNAINRHDCAA